MGEKLKKIIRAKRRSLSMEFFSCVFWCWWCLVPGCIMPYRYLPPFCCPCLFICVWYGREISTGLWKWQLDRQRSHHYTERDDLSGELLRLRGTDGSPTHEPDSDNSGVGRYIWFVKYYILTNYSASDKQSGALFYFQTIIFGEKF